MMMGADHVEDDMDECFSDLTQKWLELKQKNLTKLKTHYEESKQKFYQEPEMETFGRKQLILEPEALEKDEVNEMDDAELNRMLKSNNFSASRLLNTKGMASSQNSRKPSQYIESLNTEQTKGEKPNREPLQVRNYHLNINKGPTGKKTERELAKYENPDGDLMDLVDSLE